MALLAFVLAGCAAKNKLQEQSTPEALFEKALAALHNRHFTDAQELFDRFTLQFPTHGRVQEARYHLAEAYFGKKEYVTAANEFSRLANDYPAGPYADDARFKVCESYDKLSPKPQLDQQYTRAALDHCQSLITYYPSSELAPRAQELLTGLRTKLADKQYLAAEFYFKRGAYDSAVIYYEAALRDYPDTNVAPRALLRLFETYKILNYKDEMEAARQRLLKDYPDSPEAKQLPQSAPAAAS
ncbi:MAG TPA: outer membrane protein assembly factor BamD [Longimicrobiales bacterium]